MPFPACGSGLQSADPSRRRSEDSSAEQTPPRELRGFPDRSIVTCLPEMGSRTVIGRRLSGLHIAMPSHDRKRPNPRSVHETLRVMCASAPGRLMNNPERKYSCGFHAFHINLVKASSGTKLIMVTLFTVVNHRRVQCFLRAS